MRKSTPPNASVSRRAAALRGHALTYPEATEDFPWGHTAFKVRGKIFVTLVADGDGLRVSLKLPHSNTVALDRSFTEPTHYGMGKHGWVTSTFAPDEEPPLELLRAWIDESYRAIAPVKLVAVLDGVAPAAKAARPPRKASARAATKPRAPGRRSSPRKAR